MKKAQLNFAGTETVNSARKILNWKRFQSDDIRLEF